MFLVQLRNEVQLTEDMHIEVCVVCGILRLDDGSTMLLITRMGMRHYTPTTGKVDPCSKIVG